MDRGQRTQPMPDTLITVGEFQEDALNWPSDIESEEINSKIWHRSRGDQLYKSIFVIKLSSFTVTTQLCHSLCLLCHFQSILHSTEQADENGFLPLILDTGATHCLLPLGWLTPEQAAFSKRTRLKVASGTSVRALLYNNLICCKTVSLLQICLLSFDLGRPTQGHARCEIHLEWLFSFACSLLRWPQVPLATWGFARFRFHGALWNAATWSHHLGRKLALFHWSAPAQRLPPDHAAFA